MADKAYSYNDLSIRQDLWDSIKDLDPMENYVTSHAGEVDVTQKIHSWEVDPIATSTTQDATIEGADTSYSMTDPTLLYNHTQIIEKGIKVTKTNQNSNHAAFSDKFAREKMKKMKEWKNQFELSAVIGSLASGDGSANARKMQGIIRFASTLATVESTITLTSDKLNTYLGLAWDQGADMDTILVGKLLKQRISGFTTPLTRNVDASSKALPLTIGIYESDHGTQTIVKHRYVDLAATGSNHLLCAYMSDYVSTGALDEVHYEDRPNSGYYKAGAIVGEVTVQVANEKSVMKIDGLA